VACTLEASIALVDCLSIRVTERLPRVGRAPEFLAPSPDGRLLLASEKDGQRLEVVDLDLGQTVSHIESPHLALPRAMLFSPDGARVYVLSQGGEALVEVHAPSWKILRTLPLGRGGSADMCFSGDAGRLYVAHASGALSLVDLATWAVVAQADLSGPAGGVALTSDGRRLLVSMTGENLVRAHDPATLAVQGEVRTGQAPGVVALAPGNRQAVVINQVSNDVTVFDPRKMGRSWRIGVGVGPRRVAFAPDGRRAYVSNYNTDDLSVLDLENYRQLGRLVVGRGPSGVAWIP
jgi:YVTN family beta-propeller protein